MPDRRVAVYTITFRDGRVESFKWIHAGEQSIMVHTPDDHELSEQWKREGIVARRYPWSEIRSVDYYVNYVNDVQDSEEFTDAERPDADREPLVHTGEPGL